MDAVKIKANATLRDALNCLAHNDHGICFMVDNDDCIIGTLTDGDCRRALIRGLTLESPAREAIHCNFIAVDESFSLDQIHLLMHTNGVRQIPVVDDKKRLIRVVSKYGVDHAKAARPNAALILAGGKGQRLRPLTRHMPKPLLPVAGRPMIEHLVCQLVNAHITTIYISVNYLGHMIESHFGDGSKWGARIEYLRENTELGTGGPLKLLEGKTNAPVLVLNGDLITTVNFGAFLDFHQSFGSAISIGVTSYQVQVPYGVVNVDQDGRITTIEEKPTHTFPVNGGLYVVDPSLISLIPSGQSYPMTTLIQNVLDQNKKVGAFMIHEVWDDVGMPMAYVNAQTLLQE